MNSVVNMIYLSEIAVVGIATQPILPLLRGTTANVFADRQV